ncbi:MAG TPA: membrane protein insertion efficiency factor YidD [Candidatus Latescibacteria bacterium]|nr:membrane protein insertion efficiency factor YidD [Candidatus Latescibacterota bacterium]
MIRLYQLTLSPLFGTRCRYHPTCSAYAQEAVAKYGIFRGALLGVKRLLRCHPFHEGGIDPVP